MVSAEDKLRRTITWFSSTASYNTIRLPGCVYARQERVLVRFSSGDIRPVDPDVGGPAPAQRHCLHHFRTLLPRAKPHVYRQVLPDARLCDHDLAALHNSGFCVALRLIRAHEGKSRGRSPQRDLRTELPAFLRRDRPLAAETETILKIGITKGKLDCCAGKPRRNPPCGSARCFGGDISADRIRSRPLADVINPRQPESPPIYA